MRKLPSMMNILKVSSLKGDLNLENLITEARMREPVSNTLTIGSKYCVILLVEVSICNWKIEYGFRNMSSAAVIMGKINMIWQY